MKWKRREKPIGEPGQDHTITDRTVGPVRFWWYRNYWGCQTIYIKLDINIFKHRITNRFDIRKQGHYG